MKMLLNLASLILIAGIFFTCSDEPGTEADKIGIAAECTLDESCSQDDATLTCQTEFKGGYCGIEGCTAHSDCPEGSICVAQDGVNYCMRTCVDKPECNLHRTLDNESNCSGSFNPVTDVEGNVKVCIPPSSGVK